LQRERAGIRRVAQEEGGDRGRAFHSGERPDALEELVVELGDLRLLEAAAGGVDAQGEDVFRAEAGIRAVEGGKRAEEQAGAGEQKDGERTLHGDEDGAGSGGAAGARKAASRPTERFLEVDAGEPPRGPEAEGERGEGGDGDAEGE